MSVIWKDGHFIDGLAPQILHNDAGFANALGVFDTMRAERGVLIEARAHFERLVHDANIVLGIGGAWLPGFSHMTEAWLPLLARNHLTGGHARIKTIVTGGITEGVLKISDLPTVVVTVAPSAAPEDLPPLACAVVKNHPRVAGDVLENCKRLDYTRSFAARRKAQGRGADEAILTNTQGNIACAATSNVFIEENGVLFTPPLSDGVLAGITRAAILRERNAREDSISEDRLRGADKIFLTNSFFGMRRVTLRD